MERRKDIEKQLHDAEKLLEESFRPLSASEIEEWEGWIEIESDPVSVPATSTTTTLIFGDLGIL